MRKPLFHLLAVGHVADVQDQRLQGRLMQHVRDRDFAVRPAAKLVTDAATHADRVRGCGQRLLHPAVKDGAVGRVQQFAEGLTDQLRRGIGEKPIDGGAQESHRALRIREHNDIARVLHQRSEVCLGIAQGGGLRLEFLVERHVVPEHDELAPQDEAGDPHHSPEEEHVWRTADVLHHRHRSGDSDREIGKGQTPATGRLVV